MSAECACRLRTRAANFRPFVRATGSRRERKPQGECAAAPFTGAIFDRSIVFLGEAMGKGEAEAAALNAARE